MSSCAQQSANHAPRTQGRRVYRGGPAYFKEALVPLQTTARGLRYIKLKANRMLDRVSERNIPQLMAGTLGLLALYQAGAMLFAPDRFMTSPAFSTVLAVALPPAWAAWYAMAGAAVLTGAALDRDFTRGASLWLCGLHAAVGVMTIFPIVGGLGLPTAFSSYMGSAVFCYINYLMWRARTANRE